MELHPLVPDRIWCAWQPLRIGPIRFRGRMTVIRRADGGLWVHSPARPAPGLLRRLRRLGPVRDVIAPNREHHLYFESFLAAFPGARGWLTPGLAERHAALAHLPPLDAAARARWEPELHGVFIAGLPRLDETAWFHAPTRTLLLTDLLLCFGRDNPALLRLAAALVGALERPSFGRHLRPFVRDRAALARSVDALLALDFERVVLAHDQVIEAGARAAVESAFAWLPRR